MRRFADLYRQLDETTKTSRRVAALRDYFAASEPADAAWAMYFLSGRRPKRLIAARHLRDWCCAVADIPDWLFDECYQSVGDTAETIALLLPPSDSDDDRPLHRVVTEELLPLAGLNESLQRASVLATWSRLSPQESFVFTKLVTGSFRVGVADRTVVLALAAASKLPASVLAHRLMGQWDPTPEFYEQLLAPDATDTDRSRPYPFCLAHPLQADPESLGDITDWWAEWKWDGIRGQLIRRGGHSYLWSRGEELILDRFPELIEEADQLPEGTVLDGEILAWRDGQVMPFAALQKRIGRKSVGKKLLADVPAKFVAFDLLEHGGDDWREQPFRSRRQQMEEVLAGLSGTLSLLPSDDNRIIPSPRVEAGSWEELAETRRHSRDRQVEGLMLKRIDSPYAVGRVTGHWWKWKVDPYSCDAVLVYAQKGTGRRASLFTDYTFAVWDNGELVPFAKAYSGLTDQEIREVDRFIRQHTRERFGPVHAVDPKLVFELAFENIQLSSRHKSGIAVRFPRMARWRKDKMPEDADTLALVRSLAPAEVGA